MPVKQQFEKQFRRILQSSLQKAPEEMLDEYLQICMQVTGASGGSILSEEGPFLKFVFSDVEALIGMRVPWDSIAGVTARQNKIVYTFAPADKRHYTGIDAQVAKQTRYLLSIPILAVHSSNESSRRPKSSGVLQLLFEDNILPNQNTDALPQEFSIETLKEETCYEETLQEVFWLLPNIAFGMEVMRLRETSYQVIHELKNKLIGTQSWIACLREDLGDMDENIVQDENIKEDMELAETAAREGAGLAKGYLQFTKIYSPQTREANLNDVVAESARNVQAFAEKNGGESVTVETDLDPALPVSVVDPDQLKMAFFNLGKNAAEALIELGTATPCIRFSSRLDGKTIHIMVADNGPGMPPEIAENLFVAFKTKKAGGTGLGLTITKKIIDVHGGIIQCRTGSDGTTFEIEF